jgi:2-amino-4-hydroxy-6-hydroxymethyldihydropteridine diphosphokinase
LNNSPLVAIALGSNLGDRDAHFDFAVSRLASVLTDARISSRYDTAPVDVIGEQPIFMNAAIVGRTDVPPHDLLRELQQIEAARGRERPYVNAPRTLDLDLILYGSLVLEDDLLVLPHPRFRERTFVLEPLVEVAPDLVDPVTGLSIAALLARLRR